MFHRVKSEVQPEPVQETNKAKAPEQKGGDVKNLKEAETDFEFSNDAVSDTTIESETSVEKQQSVNPKKEEKNMSQQTPEEKAETQTSSANEQTADAANTYQRPSAPVQNVGGYPGSYPGYNAPNAGQENVASAGDRRLTIGAGITMSGEIESCDYLLVEGTVEAALKGASVLDIAESGVFYGTVEIADATIAGRFEGDITAHGRLTLREGATVTGTIAYKELEIEAGAVIDGKLTPLQAAAAKPVPSVAKKDTAKPAAKDSKAAQKDVSPEPANTDGGLFTKTAAVAE